MNRALFDYYIPIVSLFIIVLILLMIAIRRLLKGEKRTFTGYEQAFSDCVFREQPLSTTPDYCTQEPPKDSFTDFLIKNLVYAHTGELPIDAYYFRKTIEELYDSENNPESVAEQIADKVVSTYLKANSNQN